MADFATTPALAAEPMELAGAAEESGIAREAAAGPVTESERIQTIDVVRGFAVMGILLMNIGSFSGPWEMYINPLSVSGHRTLNLVAWTIRWVFFEGKMRALFSMLFGAGVILLTERADRRGSRSTADIFLRRNMWLALFGMLHFYFVWSGDILFWYGITALLFLYPCRKLRARSLLVAGLAVLALGSGYDTVSTLQALHVRQQGQAAQALSKAGKKLTAAQQDALKEWNGTLDRRQKEHDDDLKAMRGSYLQQIEWRAQWGPRIEADVYYTFGFADVLAMMLIGMGLYRLGFLTGALNYATYGWTIAAGFLISLPANGFEAFGMIRSNFDPDTPWWVLYQLGRIAGALALVSIVIVVCKAGLVPALARRLAAVGRTALSNYLFTSVSCTVFFCGLKLYGRFEYFQLFAVVAVVWVLNLTLSTVWLRHFQFGPAEWVWRSLTYWKRQPMARRKTAKYVATDQAVAA